MDYCKYWLVRLLCVSVLFSATVDGTPVDMYDEDGKTLKNCPSCTKEQLHPRFRREGGINFADIAREFMVRGGAQAIAELLSSEDKMSVLKRVLGTQIAASFVGQGALSSLISGMMSGSRGGGRPASGSGGRAPSGNGPSPTMPPGAARYDPPSAATAATNPDDTEY